MIYFQGAYLAEWLENILLQDSDDCYLSKKTSA